MNIQDILTVKGSTVFTVPPEATLQDVVQTLVEHRIGSLVVCRPDAAGKDGVAGHHHRARHPSRLRGRQPSRWPR